MVSPRWRGSSASRGSGRPWATSQKGQRRVHRSPMIMKVAVPWPKHSPMFGHEASSQTVCSCASRRIFLISVKRAPPPARTRIHSGLRKGSDGTTFIGMREVLRARFCWSLRSGSVIVRLSGSRGREAPRERRGKALLHCMNAITHAQVRETRRGKARIPARIDTREGREVGVDVERHAVIAAAARNAKPDGGNLRFVHVDAGHSLAPRAVDAVS